MEDFYQKYSKLLQEFDSLPRLKISKNIFDVTGYSHYENITSNILAFYFDPNNEHGLDDLLLRSLIDLTGITYMRLDGVKVKREFPTKKGIIDFLIETNDRFIGIENKIYSYLHNDLDDYSSSIDQWVKASNKVGSIKIVLSIHDLSCRSGFINVTYEQYCCKIRENMGAYVNASSQKWILYLIDFLTNLENLGGKIMRIDRNDQFFIDNHSKIESLIEARDGFMANLHNKVKVLCEIIERPNGCHKQWIFSSDCLVHDYNLSKYKIALDLRISPLGWNLTLFGRNEKDTAHLDELFLLKPLSEKEINFRGTNGNYGDNRYVLAEHELNTSLEDIAENLLEWSNILIKTDKNYNAKNKETNPA